MKIWRMWNFSLCERLCYLLSKGHRLWNTLVFAPVRKKLELAGDFFALHIATYQQKMNNNKIKQSCYLTHAPEHCSLLVHQLFGWVQLHDPSLGQNHHPVVVEDGVQTVGNSDDCAKKNMIAFIVKHIYFQKLII